MMEDKCSRSATSVCDKSPHFYVLEPMEHAGEPMKRQSVVTSVYRRKGFADVSGTAPTLIDNLHAAMSLRS
ncbi:MAG: hypothetical protein KDA81_13280 [Planctomycetaceae bacterium]|nr:hypothetical protein [Planctomycetaceae bacterium]